ncbi:MAG: threonine/serine dehydratase [Gemmatimonadaceae bacterium]|nr:threonine/serine dehydratase [Gemmatimonadaceae bacterium]
MSPHPITFADVTAARARIRPFFDPSPARHYPMLDELVGHGVRVFVKHENHLPTGSFKVRNGTASITALSPDAAARGVIAASTGNHGQGLAWAGAQRGVSVTICVPVGNNPEKSAVMRSLGAAVIEVGATYDETAAACREIADREGRTLVHSTNHDQVIAGAGTMTAEFLEQVPELDALIIALGGGSQAVGAAIVRDVLKPGLAVYAVGAAGAPTQHDAWHAKAPRAGGPVRTFAEGIATGSTYELTFASLQQALAGFVLASEDAIAQSVRDLWRITHNLAEGSGATGLAGLQQLAPTLAGQTVGMVMCGGNLDAARAATIFAGGTPS